MCQCVECIWMLHLVQVCHRCALVQFFFSQHWLTGKSAGNPHYSWKKPWIPLIFALNQPIDWCSDSSVTKTCGGVMLAVLCGHWSCGSHWSWAGHRSAMIIYSSLEDLERERDEGARVPEVCQRSPLGLSNSEVAFANPRSCQLV